MTYQKQTFRAHVGERAFEIVFGDAGVTVNGEVVDCAFEPITEGYYSLLLGGQSIPVVVEPSGGGELCVTVGDHQRQVRVKDEKALLLERYGLDEDDAAAEREVHAPMPGLVLLVLVEEGQAISAGEGLIVLEAMKMENELRATGDGIVQTIHVTPGDAVPKNALLIEFEK